MKKYNPYEMFPATVENPNGFAREKIEGIKYNMSVSRLKRFMESPGDYDWKYNQGNETARTPAQILGSLTHSAVLEPEKYKKLSLIEPEKETFKYSSAEDYKGLLKMLGGKATGKKAELVERLLELQPSLAPQLYDHAISEFSKMIKPESIVLNEEQDKKIKGMIEVIERHPIAPKLKSNGYEEVGFYWYDKENDLQWYGIIDYIRIDDSSGQLMCWVNELKTIVAADIKSWERDKAKFKYHIQNFKYEKALQSIMKMPIVIINTVVRNKEPYGVALYSSLEREKDTARQECRHYLDKFKACQANNHWPVYPENIIETDLPNWYHYQTEEIIEQEQNL